MKRSASILLFLLPTVIFCQNYQNICTQQTTYYRSPTYAVKAFRQDSAVPIGSGDTMFYSYRTIRSIDGAECEDTIGGSVLGRKVIRWNDGWFSFFNSQSDTIYLNSQASLGSTWKLCDLQSGNYIQAEVISQESDTVLGVLDQVKIISMQAKNSSNNNIPHIFNQKQIKLSQNYGLASIFDLWLFPSDTTTYRLCGKTALGLGTQDLHWKEIFDFDTNDIFHYYGTYSSQSNGGNWSKIYRVLSKTTYGNNDSVEYSMEYCKRLYVANPPSYENTYDTLIIKYNWASLEQNNAWATRLPEEFTESNGFADLYVQNFNAFDGRHMKGRVRNKYFQFSDTCWQTWGGWEEPVLTYHYTQGLGQTNYSYYLIQNYSPESMEENLVYFQKGSVSWGTPVATDCNVLVHNSANLTKNIPIRITPNPIINEATVFIDDLKINSSYTLIFYDLYGRVTLQAVINENPYIFDRQGIPDGLYQVIVTNNQDEIGNAKVILLSQ